MIQAAVESLLQSLTLYSNDRSQLPNIFSLHHLPALKHLVLPHYQFSWPQPLSQFNTLETLIIRHTPRSHVSCIIHGLLRFLSQNPNIKVLEIVQSNCRAGPSNNDHHPSSHLRFLKTVKIVSGLACVKLFLEKCTHWVGPCVFLAQNLLQKGQK